MSDKFKKGDIIVVNTLCTTKKCCNCLGLVTFIRERQKYLYEVTFAYKREKGCAVINDISCIYSEEEMRLATKDEEDKYFLIKYKD